MKISVKMSDRKFGDYHFEPEKMIVEHYPDPSHAVFLRVWPREKLLSRGAVAGEQEPLEPVVEKYGFFRKMRETGKRNKT